MTWFNTWSEKPTWLNLWRVRWKRWSIRKFWKLSIDDTQHTCSWKTSHTFLFTSWFNTCLKIIPENVIPGIRTFHFLMYWSGSEKLQIVYFYFRIQFSCHSFSVVVRICFTLSIPRIKSAAFSAIMIVGAFVFPDGILRMTEASATRRFFTPLTLVKNDILYMIIIN